MFDEKGYLPSRFLISSFPIISPKKSSSILCSFEKPPFIKQNRIKSEERLDDDENTWDEGMKQKKKKKKVQESGFEESWEEGGKRKMGWRKEQGMRKEKNKNEKHRRTKSKKLKECLFPSLEEENNEKEKKTEDVKDDLMNLPSFITDRTNIKSQQQSRQIRLIKQQIKSTFSLFKQLSDKARHRKDVLYSSKREDLYKQVHRLVYEDENRHHRTNFVDKYSSFQSFNKRHQGLKNRMEKENEKEGAWKVEKKENGIKKD